LVRLGLRLGPPPGQTWLVPLGTCEGGNSVRIGSLRVREKELRERWVQVGRKKTIFGRKMQSKS